MVKLDQLQRAELGQILNNINDEDLLAAEISEIIEARDNCKRAYGKLFNENAALEGKIDTLQEQLDEV